jgi:hypothetical protein
VWNGTIEIRQRKTGTVLVIPMHTDLIGAIEGAPSDHLTFLTTVQGKPFTPEG